MKATNLTSRLVLHQLNFSVSLGWEPAERAQPQTVTVDIHIKWTTPPAACRTDQLADTFCYATLNDTIKKALANKEFRLLECITQDIYTCVKEYLSSQHSVMIGVTKYPDAFFKSSGVTFWYGDE